MEEIESMLIPYDKQNDSDKVYIFREFDGKKFTCIDYTKLGKILAKRLYETNHNHNLFIDWTSCIIHPLIFDIDITIKDEKNSFYILWRYFHNIFLNVFEKHVPLSNFDILLSMRRDFSGGMHIHILNVEMAHDDYVHLCNLMRSKCEYFENNVKIKLDCFATVYLVACDKRRSDGDFYIPIRQIRVRRYFCENEMIWKIRKTENLVTSNNIEITSLMMPTPKQNVIYLKYPTRVSQLENNNYVAKFKSCKNDKNYAFFKENKLIECESLPVDGSFCHQFLKRNAKFINSFVIKGNTVLKTWYKRYSFKNVIDSGIFRDIDHYLKQKCIHLRDEGSPLKTLLHSTYFLPVFYSLYNMKCHRFRLDDIIDRLNKHFFKDEPIKHSINVPAYAGALNFDTILYCAFKTISKKENDGHYLKHIGMGWDWIFQSTLSVDDVKNYIITIQKTFFPIVRSFNTDLYFWDPNQDIWVQANEDKIKILIKYIFDNMKNFEGYSKIPKTLRFQLNNQFDWIDSLTNDIYIEVERSKSVLIGNKSDSTFLGGPKVPRYYFLNYELDCSSILEKSQDLSFKDRCNIIRSDFILENVFSYVIHDYYNFNPIEAMNLKEQKLFEVFKKLLDSFIANYSNLIKKLITEINTITEDIIESFIEKCSDELFAKAITWSRIIIFFIFVGELCVMCISKQIKSYTVDATYKCFTRIVLEKLEPWIVDHGGWEDIENLKVFSKQKKSMKIADPIFQSSEKELLHTIIRMIGIYFQNIN